MNSAYLLTFELIEAVPRLFRRYHQETTQRILRGCVAAHRGQVRVRVVLWKSSVLICSPLAQTGPGDILAR